MIRRRSLALLLTWPILLALFLGGCSTLSTSGGVYGVAPDPQTQGAAAFVRLSDEVPPDQPGLKLRATPPPASKEEIEAFTETDEGIYHLGPGDEFSFLVRGRPDISLPSVIVAPDGMVSLPRIGLMKIQGMSLSDVTEQVRTSLQRYYANPEVTLLMRGYKNNRVYMLGQVAHPGVVHLPGSASLLEAIAMAGGVIKDTAGNSPPLNRCIIGRGKDKVIWLDLRDLLENGNIALNARLKNGDVVFIPQGQNVVAYILGEVRQPGPILLRSQMTVLEAIARSGGMTKDADPTKVYLIRPDGEKTLVYEIDTNVWVERADLRKNLVLREGDFLYVGERGVSRFNYYLTHLLPGLQVADFARTQGAQ